MAVEVVALLQHITGLRSSSGTFIRLNQHIFFRFFFFFFQSPYSDPKDVNVCFVLRPTPPANRGRSPKLICIAH